MWGALSSSIISISFLQATPNNPPTEVKTLPSRDNSTHHLHFCRKLDPETSLAPNVIFFLFLFETSLPSKQVCKPSLSSLSPLSLKVKETSCSGLVWLELQRALTGLHQESLWSTVPIVESIRNWALWLPAGNQERQTRKVVGLWCAGAFRRRPDWLRKEISLTVKPDSCADRDPPAAEDEGVGRRCWETEGKAGGLESLSYYWPEFC